MRSLSSSGFMQTGEELLCHGHGLLKDVLSVYLAQNNTEMHPCTHSGKLSKSEMPGGVPQ
jgi:hypothetical protein